MMPPLSTIRLILKPISLPDVGRINTIISHPQFAEASIGCSLPNSQKQLIRWVLSSQKQHQQGHGCSYMLTTRESAVTIGLVNLQQKQDKNCELSYWLHPAYWRQGLMQEAVDKVVNSWRSQRVNDLIFAYVHRDNAASIALLKRIGMVLAARNDSECQERYELTDELAVLR